jgi:hypothetical protein
MSMRRLRSNRGFEFRDDGTVDVERFVSAGPVDEADLAALVDGLRADRDEPETSEA